LENSFEPSLGWSYRRVKYRISCAGFIPLQDPVLSNRTRAKAVSPIDGARNCSGGHDICKTGAFPGKAS